MAAAPCDSADRTGRRRGRRTSSSTSGSPGRSRGSGAPRRLGSSTTTRRSRPRLRRRRASASRSARSTATSSASPSRVFVHYGVELWVPEVGGAVDPGSDAHDLVMSLYGGMSKGERNRIKTRVRVGDGRPRRRSRVDSSAAGRRTATGWSTPSPHPNPAKAAHGQRLRHLEPDPVDGAGRRRHLRRVPRRRRRACDRRAAHSRRHPIPICGRPHAQPAPAPERTGVGASRQSGRS